MADIIDVSQAIVDRLKPGLPDWETFWFEPTKLPTYAMVIEPDPAMYADHEVVMGGYTRWGLRIGLFARATDQEAARLLMGRLTGRQGPIIKPLLDEDLEDDLATICRADIRLTKGKGWSVITRGRLRYLYADIGLVAGSN